MRKKAKKDTKSERAPSEENEPKTVIHSNVNKTGRTLYTHLGQHCIIYI